jgi:Carboxypeptidase regulatory-like domain/TonB-dependent Receptor Plug Domain/Gram-negative bacterial TonB protein C-terminal
MRNSLLSARAASSWWSGVFAPLCALVLSAILVPGFTAAQSSGALRGVVRDSLGGVVSNAHVAIDGSTSQTMTDANGAFRFSRLPSGEALVKVRRLGYLPVSAPVTIATGTEAHVEVKLSPLAERLPPVEVRRRAEVYDSRLAGFNERKGKHVGHFVTRERLDQMSSGRFIDALREMPGVEMRTLRGGVVTVALRGARCPPVVFIDGFPASAGVMDLDMIDLSGVEGIEVYYGMASIPPEFQSVQGGQSCGVIAIWSRPFRPRARRQEPVSRAELEKLIAEQKVYTADEVDQPAVLALGAIAAPAYPDSLWEAGVSGRVVAEFVVDDKGDIEPGTLTIASATHPYFASAVRSALDGAVFRAARLAGKSVRQLVDLPFRFQRNGDMHENSQVISR